MNFVTERWAIAYLASAGLHLTLGGVMWFWPAPNSRWEVTIEAGQASLLMMTAAVVPHESESEIDSPHDTLEPVEIVEHKPVEPLKPEPVPQPAPQPEPLAELAKLPTIPEPERSQPTTEMAAPTEIATLSVPDPAPHQPPETRPLAETVPRPPEEIVQLQPPRKQVEASVAVIIMPAEQGAQVEVLPRKLPTNPPPIYPPEAIAARLEGRVVVHAWINSQGQVDRVTLDTTSGHAMFDEAAMQAVSRWQFAPAQQAGQPTACDVLVPVRFTFRGS